MIKKEEKKKRDHRGTTTTVVGHLLSDNLLPHQRQIYADSGAVNHRSDTDRQTRPTIDINTSDLLEA